MSDFIPVVETAMLVPSPSSSSVVFVSSSSSSSSSSSPSVILVSASNSASSSPSNGSASSVAVVSSSSGSAAEEKVRDAGYANSDVGSYAEARGPHRGEWPMPVGGLRCQHYGTVWTRGVWDYNYVVNVMCFTCEGCVAWRDSLTSLQQVWVSVVEAAVGEMRDGVVTESELQAVVARYQRNSRRCLQAMVRNAVEKKMVALAVRAMVEDEAEEVSGDESVDNFE